MRLTNTYRTSIHETDQEEFDMINSNKYLRTQVILTHIEELLAQC